MHQFNQIAQRMKNLLPRVNPSGIFRGLYASILDVSVAQFSILLGRVNIQGHDFTIENYLPGTTGQSKFYRQFIDQSGLVEEE